MSFYTGTQCELLYAMPAPGPSVTGTVTNTLASQPQATGLPYQLPANFFTQQSGGGLGKSLLIKGGGYFSTTSTGMTGTFGLWLDTVSGTTGVQLATTGAFTPVASITNGAFEFEVLVTCQLLLGTGAASKLNAVGHLFWGPGNNAAAPSLASTAQTSGGAVMMIGAPNSTDGVAITNSSAYYVENYFSWSTTTGGPVLTLTNFLVFGLN